MKINLFILFSFILCLNQLYAQTEDNSAEGLYYTKEKCFGIVAHTAGWGLECRAINNKGAFKKRIKSLEIVSIHHPKEVKVKNVSYSNSKGFVYGKLYSVWAIRPSYGFQKVLYGKEIKSALQISRIFSFGPSLYYAKPVYLEVINRKSDPSGDEIVTERYDPKKHGINDIYGRSPFAIGIDKSFFLPGVFAKWSYQFDFAPDNDRLKFLELGMVADFQPIGLQIMALNKKQYLFYNLYLSFAFGKKSFH